MYTKRIHNMNGYYDYGYSVVIYDKPLKNMPYASAGVVKRDNGDIELWSYTTLVCILTSEGWLTCTGTYSQTTRKHIGAFMREYCNREYALAKMCYEKQIQYNIYTGEIREYR